MARYQLRYEGRILGEFVHQEDAFIALEGLRGRQAEAYKTKMGTYPSKQAEMIGWSVVCVPD
jgi:hypothetical protein